MVLVGPVGFRRVVDDLDGEEGFLPRKRAPPQRAKARVLIEANSATIAQIGSDALRLFSGSVAFDHDAPQIRARHALDRLDRDALRLVDQRLPNLRSMPMPPAPTGAERDRRAHFAMQLPC